MDVDKRICHNEALQETNRTKCTLYDGRLLVSYILL